MSNMTGNSASSDRKTGIGRRSVLGQAAAISAGALVAGNIALPAWATSASDKRLNLYEGKYAIDSHKIVDGYFAFPRGRQTAMDVLIVLPGATGIDDATRDVVRHHALSGKIAFAPDLARTSGTTLATRGAMIADLLSHTHRLERFAHASGKVTVVSA